MNLTTGNDLTTRNKFGIGLRNGATCSMSLRPTGFITLRITFRVFLSDEYEAETSG